VSKLPHGIVLSMFLHVFSLTAIIIIIIIIPVPILWYCHYGTAIARVHPVHLTNVANRRVAGDVWTKPVRKFIMRLLVYRNLIHTFFLFRFAVSFYAELCI